MFLLQIPVSSAAPGRGAVPGRTIGAVIGTAPEASPVNLSALQAARHAIESLRVITSNPLLSRDNAALTESIRNEIRRLASNDTTALSVNYARYPDVDRALRNISRLLMFHGSSETGTRIRGRLLAEVTNINFSLSNQSQVHIEVK